MSDTAGSVRLCAWRKTQGISQKLAGPRFGVSEQSYRGWERDWYRPKGDARERVRQVTKGLVQPIDFMRPPDKLDDDLSNDVSHLREQAAQQPAAGAA